MLTKLKSDKELIRKLKIAAKIKMTAEQIRAQKISYAYGNLPSESSITKTEVEKIVEKIEGKAA
jgi:hypothetical protein